MNNNLTTTQKKIQTNKLYLATIQDDDGVIQKVLTGPDYEQLWLLSSSESKAMRGYWTLFDLHQGTWRFVDGNYRPRLVK